jgi:hypothetical protein
VVAAGAAGVVTVVVPAAGVVVVVVAAGVCTVRSVDFTEHADTAAESAKATIRTFMKPPVLHRHSAPTQR